MIDRRTFLSATLTAGAALTVAPLARAIDPIRRTGKPHLRLSLAAYSFRDQLSPRAPAQPTMSLDDFIDLSAALELDAVEPTSYYFRDTSPDFMSRFKGRCTRLGLDVSGTAVGNDFCTPDADKLKAALANVKVWTEHAARLGAKTVRIFAGTIDKKTPGETEATALKRCIPLIQEACDHAAKYGVYLALENHGGITATAEQLLGIVKEVKHEFFGVNLDTGNFKTADPYADLAKIAPYAVNVQVKTEIQREGQKKEDADLKRLVRILRDAGYRGYVALEYEATEDPKLGVPKAIGELRKLLREE